MKVKEYLSEERLYLLDGGMGVLLQKKGLPPGKPPEVMNLSNPKAVQEVYRSYLESGADLIETNTFGGNRITLERHNLASQIEEINMTAVQMAREVVSDHLIAGSIGPTGQLLAPLGPLDPDQAEEAYTEQCALLKEAGVDLINIETMTDLAELKAAVIAARKNGLPVMAEATFMPNGHMLSGADPFTVVATLEGLGVMAGGINCGLGPNEIRPLLYKMTTHSCLPLVAQPNAGLPEVVDDETRYPLDPIEFGALMRELVTETNPFIIGGCCGTTPAHIRLLDQMRADLPRRSRRKKTLDAFYITGRSRGLLWKNDWADYRSIEVEALTEEELRLNKEVYDLFALTERLREDSIEIIRLNLDHWRIEPQKLKGLLQQLQLYFPGPLCVCGKNSSLLEVFFRYYIGRPLWELSAHETDLIHLYLPGAVIIE